MTSRFDIRKLTAVVSLTFTAACEGAPGSPDAVQRRDSAGVEIVENGSGTIAQLGSIVDGQAARSLGGPELSRVTAARLLDDGSIVITDDGGQQLVFLDTGAVVRTVGRRGEGPDEFRGFRGMWRCSGDTLIVRGSVTGVKIFSATGEFIRMSGVPWVRGVGYGASNDCGSIITLAPRLRPLQTDVSERDSVAVVWQSLEHDSALHVITVADNPRQAIEYRGENMLAPIPFGDRPLVVAAGNRVYVAPNGSAEVRVFDRAARLVQIVRWAAVRPSISEADRDRYSAMREQLDDRIGPGTSERVPDLSAFELPDTKPVLSAILAADDGHLWVRKYPDIWEGFERLYGPAVADSDADWWVFSPSGRLLGTVTTPGNFTIHDIRNGLVLGVRVDADNVPSLIVFPMRMELLQIEP